MKKQQVLRGALLDEALDTLLAQMLSLGMEIAPISRPEVQRRLGLASRATLVGDRGSRIDSARAAQFKESGYSPDNVRRRNSLEERIAKQKLEIIDLVDQRDRLYEALCLIAHECILKGLDVEAILGSMRIR